MRFPLVGTVRVVCQVHDSIVVVVVVVVLLLVIGRSTGSCGRVVCARAGHHLQLYVSHDVLFDAMHSVEVAVQGVLTSVLLAALWADDISVLVPKVHVFDVPLQAHLVKVLVAVRTALPGSTLFVRPTARVATFGRGRGRRRTRHWPMICGSGHARGMTTH